VIPVLEFTKVTKYYGDAVGVVDLDLEVTEGEVFGYLGPNGAGKTTTIRLLLDLIRPTAGTIKVFGRDAHADSVDLKRSIGYVPGELAFYDKMTGANLIEYLGSFRGGVDRARVESLCERLDFDPSIDIRAYSSGNRQKLGLIQAFMSRPELLVLDEPSNGLDPLIQQEFLQLVTEAGAGGTTVFLSSHVLSEVQAIADRVGIIRHGVLVAVEGVQQLRAKALQRVMITFEGPAPIEEFARLPGVSDVAGHDRVVEFSVEGSMDDVIKAAARYDVVGFNTTAADLEDVFLTYYRDDDAQ
jgi:ABC-2 type transport system ATP-binding protein